MADASVIAVVERLKASEVATLDERHFRAVTPAHVTALTAALSTPPGDRDPGRPRPQRADYLAARLPGRPLAGMAECPPWSFTVSVATRHMSRFSDSSGGMAGESPRRRDSAVPARRAAADRTLQPGPVVPPAGRRGPGQGRNGS